MNWPACSTGISAPSGKMNPQTRDLEQHSARSLTPNSGAATKDGANGWFPSRAARLKEQLIRSGAAPNEIKYSEQVLDPESLTIGFARRFAQYKRADLLFRDLNRLKNMLNNKNQPVQIIIAGKAHPSDNIGKELIKNIIHMIRQPELRDKIVFLEDYDMNVAHYLVQGADIWLNTPRRPPRGLGHQRHEGRGERRAEPERSGRLVVRGLQRRQRLGDRFG